MPKGIQVSGDQLDTAEPFENGDTVRYEPWTDGWAIGYKVTNGDQVYYVYLNPSSGGDAPDIFLYAGEHGDPSDDYPIIYINTAKDAGWRKLESPQGGSDEREGLYSFLKLKGK